MIPLQVMRLGVVHVDTTSSGPQIDSLEEAEALTARWQASLPGSFMNAQAYIFFDQYRTPCTH